MNGSIVAIRPSGVDVTRSAAPWSASSEWIESSSGAKWAGTYIRADLNRYGIGRERLNPILTADLASVNVHFAPYPAGHFVGVYQSRSTKYHLDHTLDQSDPPVPDPRARGCQGFRLRLLENRTFPSLSIVGWRAGPPLAWVRATRGRRHLS